MHYCWYVCMCFACVEYVMSCSVLLYVAVCCSDSTRTYVHYCWYAQMCFEGAEYVMSCSLMQHVVANQFLMQATRTPISLYMSPVAVCCKQPGHLSLYICHLLQCVASDPDTYLYIYVPCCSALQQITLLKLCKQPGYISLYICPLLQCVEAN